MYTKKTQKTSNIQYPISSICRAGFTLVELIVTVSIIALISTVVLVRNGQFDNEVLLADVAYDVALSVRQAQNYGINVLGQGNEFDFPYGVYFEPDMTTYTLFQDKASTDYRYTPDEETLETFTLGRGFTVARICTDVSSLDACDVSRIENATIIFKRPNPDAIINADEKGGSAMGAVGIELVAPRGGSRFIVVRSTGQISVTQLQAAESGGIDVVQ
ncbi:type II secretion system protein [Candidatus Campbellbacteria bacterium]|nr:MAG: type II secretion system protein [Candidatus Campbellbacteria bacterium]